MARHRADEPTPDDVLDVLDVQEVPLEPAPIDPVPIEPVAIEPVPIEPVAAAPDPPPTPPLDTGYTARGVPTFESVREKIETRFGTSVGSVELASETTEGRHVEQQYDARQQAAHERLEQIRASMRDDSDHA